MKALTAITSAYTYLDLEVGAQEDIYCLGFVSDDMAHEFNGENLTEAYNKLTYLKNCGLKVCGHNFRRFDYPRLINVAPELSECQIIDTLELSLLTFPLRSSHELNGSHNKYKYAFSSPLECARATRLLLHEQINALLTEPKFYQQLITWLLASGLDCCSMAYRQLFCDLLDWTVVPMRIEKLPQEMLVGIDHSYLQKLLLSPQTYDFDTRLCVAALLVWNYENNITQSKVAYSNWLSNLPPFNSVLNNLFGQSYNEIAVQFSIEKKSFNIPVNPTQEKVQTIINRESILIMKPNSSGKTLCYKLPASTLHYKENRENCGIREKLNQTYKLTSGEQIIRSVVPEYYNDVLEPLSDSQKKIVLADDSALSIIGSPGSGKTTIIVYRIAYLVKVKLIDPHSILVLASNRNTITEIRVKLQQLIGELGMQVRVLTFQKLSLILLGRALNENTKTQFNFNQLITETCSLLEKDDDSSSQLSRTQLLGNLQHLFIDDYQDINENEYRLIKLISGLDDSSKLLQTNICVVADDDQSIYKDRGADAKYILQFEEEYEAKRLLLTENHRCGASIVSAANKLISHNKERYKFTTFEQVRIEQMHRGYKGFPIEAYTFDSIEVQATWIQQRICSRIEQGADLKDIAVFARNWDSLDAIRLFLERVGIPTCTFRKDNIELVRNYITCKLIDELRPKRHQLLPPDKSVLDWFKTCFRVWGRQFTEPSVQILLRIARDIDIERGYGIADLALPISADEILTSVFEFNQSLEAFRDENAVLVTTCHGAKEFEFEKVILLGDDFSTDAAIETERRLFYVAMTRAKSELVMCSTKRSQFIYETGAEPERLNVKIDFLPEQMLCFDLAPDDIFPGHYSTKKNQQVIVNLMEGAELEMKVNSYSNGWDILTVDGQKVGASSKEGNSKLTSVGCIPGEFEFCPGEVRVKNVYRHLKIDEVSGITEDWFIVIPQIRVCR
ncbi:ATP-dependent DNA helicase RecQ [Calothrix sp. NIES-4071]|nr:ATP-dependent DNA helicase RecQ [Calothrix sp. NIES-4071]BAZ54576.1 ATP-dependent DNA helicase RecQ [Calothrix sp. NIES-4105]